MKTQDKIVNVIVGISLILFILGILFMGIGLDKKVVGEQLCADGNNNLNLEGIMCEKTETIWFGMNPHYSLLCFLPSLSVILLGFFFLVRGRT